MGLEARDLYHTGVVVDDLPAAMKTLSAVAGYRWTNEIAAPLPVWTPAGIVEVTFRFVYSLDAPHVELVQSIPDTVWVPAPGNAVHHLGYFVDDLSAVSADLVSAGMPVEVCGSFGNLTPAMFSYHKGVDGIRIEIVDRAAMGDWDTFLRNNSAEPGM